MEIKVLKGEITAFNISAAIKDNAHYDVMYHVKLFLFMSFGSIIIFLGVLYIFTEVRMRQKSRSSNDRTPLIQGIPNHLISTEPTAHENETFL